MRSFCPNSQPPNNLGLGFPDCHGLKPLQKCSATSVSYITHIKIGQKNVPFFDRKKYQLSY